jgi:hypothetical protein
LGSMPDKLFQWVNSREKIFLTISGDCEARRFEATVGDGKEGPKTPAGKTDYPGWWQKKYPLLLVGWRWMEMISVKLLLQLSSLPFHGAESR